LQEVHKADIPFKEAKKVKLALASRLLTYSPDAASAGIADTVEDFIRHHPVVWEAIRCAVKMETGIDVGTDSGYAVEHLGHNGDIRVSTSLVSKDGMSEEQQHKFVERGVITVANLNQRIRFMESFEAVTGFQADEVPFFEKKLSFIMRQLDPDVQERRFERVVTIGGLPGVSDLPAGSVIDVDRLLKLRDDAECRELRSWIRNVDSETDEEINARFKSVRARVASVVESKSGKVVRFLATSGAGAIPVIGIGAGPLISAADTFLLEKVIGKPGPATFLSKNYPSIFRS
jgi:hypothetical protein